MIFLDCELATFYQVFPHIALGEMSNAVPSTEALYSARSYDIWQSQISHFVGTEVPPLRTILSQLMHPGSTPDTMFWADCISIHGLLQVLCGKYKLLALDHLRHGI